MRDGVASWSRGAVLVRLAARAMPVLWRSARASGLSRRAALEVLAASIGAVLVARSRHPGTLWEQNAVRHFIWQAWLASRFGPEVAGAVAAGHEQLSTDALDSQVDARNNAEALEFARAWAPGRAVTLSTLLELADVGAEYWREGRLWTGRPGRAVRRAGPKA